MQSSSARTLRGLSIAIIVIAILAALFSLFAGIATGGLGILAADPDVQASVNASIDPSTTSQLDEYGLTTQDAASVTSFFMLLGGAGMIVCALFAVVALVSGIMGLRGAKDPGKAGASMGWMIAGAIVSALSLNVVLLILCIIGAVFANKTKKEAAANFVPYGAGPR